MAKEYIILDDVNISQLIKGEIVTVKQRNGETLRFKYKPVMTAQMTAPVTIQVEQPVTLDINDISKNIFEQTQKSVMGNARRSSRWSC